MLLAARFLLREQLYLRAVLERNHGNSALQRAVLGKDRYGNRRLSAGGVSDILILAPCAHTGRYDLLTPHNHTSF